MYTYEATPSPTSASPTASPTGTVSLTYQPLGVALGGDEQDIDFGFSVSMNRVGSRVAIGDPGNRNGVRICVRMPHIHYYYYFASWLHGLSSWCLCDVGGRARAGRVRVYGFSTSTSSWSELTSPLDGTAADDQFGHSVSMSSDGSRLAVGALRSSDGSAN